MAQLGIWNPVPMTFSQIGKTDDPQLLTVRLGKVMLYAHNEKRLAQFEEIK